jgi:predicted negative regulator of RcsB-dependent stress response
MNRNLLYAVIGALIVVVGILGYRYYQASQTTGIEIEMDDSGISIQGN